MENVQAMRLIWKGLATTVDHNPSLVQKYKAILNDNHDMVKKNTDKSLSHHHRDQNFVKLLLLKNRMGQQFPLEDNDKENFFTST